MAITKMKRLEIVGLNNERKRLIEYLQRCGVVDISDSREEGLESRETATVISQLDQYMSSASEALDILRPYSQAKGGMFYIRPEISADNYAATSGEMAEITALVSEVIKLRKQREKNREDIASYEATIRSLEPYKMLDIPLGTKTVGKVNIRIGTLDGEWDEERLWKVFNDAEIQDVYFEILSKDCQQTAVFVMYHNDAAKRVEPVLAGINLLAPPINTVGKTPLEYSEELRARCEALKNEYEDGEIRIKELATNKGKIELFYDKLSLRREKYNTLARVGITENAFFVSGYIPEKAGEKLLPELEKQFIVSAELIEPDVEEDVPKAFENNAFVSPVEGITSDYSMPSSHDVDPNPIMAFFYYFFFGMMFSDAGYGLILMIVCGLLGFGSFMEKDKRRAYKMFFFCGVSTTFWGIMYGSFFGDMIATVSKTFGDGSVAFTPILMDPVQKPLQLLIMSVAFGLVHILTAIATKFYMTWRDGDKFAAICDSGFWFVLLFGLAVFAGGMALGIKILETVGLVMLIGSAAGLILTQGRNQKNPIMKLFGGILSLYDITSYVGDILSYSRLMALGLATGVIASVINVLGSLGGDSVVGMIAFIAISIFGHALNFAINMLGAYVHTNRLQYVEFYQKFYEGGGKKYKPFGFNTKYFRFKN
ncbi:MAG: V-type ATP synthase subunit I [Eubacteriales bacterium]|nr:V-type ATP synthase subunit I [Eubacteriales bacterium]